MDAFMSWLAHHPPMLGLIALGPALILFVVSRVIEWLKARRQRKDRYGVPTVQAVRDMIREQRNPECIEESILFREAVSRIETRQADQDRRIQALQRSNQSLQRAVQALQRKAQAEGKAPRKTRGKKAQDAWDVINRDDPDA